MKENHIMFLLLCLVSVGAGMLLVDHLFVERLGLSLILGGIVGAVRLPRGK